MTLQEFTKVLEKLQPHVDKLNKKFGVNVTFSDIKRTGYTVVVTMETPLITSDGKEGFAGGNSIIDLSLLEKRKDVQHKANAKKIVEAEILRRLNFTFSLASHIKDERLTFEQAKNVDTSKF